MSTPPLKLLTLFIRQLSRPLALTINAIALRNRGISSICARTAVSVDSWNKHFEQRIFNTANVKHHGAQVHHNRVVEHGSMILAESSLYVLATAVIILESYRSRQREAERHEETRDDILMLQDEIEHLKRQLEQNHVYITQYMPPNGMRPAVLQVIDGSIQASQRAEQEE